MIGSLHIIYASTSGHTEYVVNVLDKHLKKKAPKLAVEIQRCEEVEAKDFERGDALLLACATWNMWGIEGQLPPVMHALLAKRAKDVELKGKPVAHISLGEDRYYYTGRATEHLMQYTIQHGGKPTGIPLLIVNDPYGQEEKIQKWGDQLIDAFKNLK